MEITVNCRLAEALAQRMHGAKEDLTRRWLDRIAARVTIDPNRIFPSDDLLDHVPVLISGIADYLQNPADEITADIPVVAKAIELGELRFSQGFPAPQLLKEYEILGGVLYSFLIRSVDEIDEPCTPSELLACGHRLFRAVSIIQSITTSQFLRLLDDRIREREERLRGFNRMVSHELKNRIGVVLGASQLLTEEWIRNDAEQLAKFAGIVVDNAEEMQTMLQNLMELSRTDVDVRQQRHVLLPEAAAEAARQLRTFAESHGVEIRIRPDVPPVEVNAAVVELCLSNYLSNAIKYCDPASEERWVEVGGSIELSETGEAELVVRARDNGLGVPEEARPRLFQRYFRADREREYLVEGTGLGLSIVRETIAQLGGRTWAEFGPGAGSTFCFSLPCRRTGECDVVVRSY
jgi:signal transduction histidine kinase